MTDQKKADETPPQQPMPRTFDAEEARRRLERMLPDLEADIARLEEARRVSRELLNKLFRRQII